MCQSSMGTLCEHGQSTLSPEESDGDSPVSLCQDAASENMCGVYPDDGPCAAFGYRGMPVFIPAGSCAAELFTSIDKYIKSASIASEACYPFMMQFVCSQVFFPCEYTGDVPVPSLFCLPMCNSFFEQCAFELKSISSKNNCDSVTVGVGSRVGGGIDNNFFEENKESISGYVGELYFPAKKATFHGLEEPLNVSCTTLPNPSAETRVSLSAACELDKTLFVSVPGSIRCGFRCPYPAYSTTELRVMWALYCFPALLSFPLNFVVIVQHKRGRRRQKTAVVLSSVCAVLWFLVDPLPAIVLFTEVACPKRRGHLLFLRRSHTLLCVGHLPCPYIFFR
jgi:hypothetical protein